MRLFRFASLVMIAGLAGCMTMEPQCAPWRPCGAGNSWGGNSMVPQGFYGADFREACNGHDTCYASCANRYDCDRAFLDNMYCACESSYNPAACRRKANFYYAMARMFGGILRE